MNQLGKYFGIYGKIGVFVLKIILPHNNMNNLYLS